MNTILFWSLQSLFTTAVLIPIVVLLSRLFRYRPAVQHALWVVVLLKFVTPSIVEWPWQLSGFRDVVPSHILEQTDAFSLTSSTNSSSNSIASSATASAADSADDPEQVTTSQVFSVDMQRVSVLQALLGVLTFVWLVGATLFVSRQYRRVMKQALFLKRATDAPPILSNAVRDVALRFGLRPIPLLIVPGITSPFVWCLGQLKLAWPEQMLHDRTIAATRSIIAHELAHVRRRDHWVAWLELVAGTIWWWHPLFWFVSRNLRTSAEMACDALAIETFPEDRCVYAELLLRLSADPENRTPLFVLGISDSTPRHFERRMSMIVSEMVTGKLSTRGMLLAGLLAVASVPTWSFSQANDQGKASASATGDANQADPVPIEIDFNVSERARRNFAVFPIKTALQRRKMGSPMEDRANIRAYVFINGMAVVNDAGMIDEKALNMDALRKALAPYADSQNGIVFFNVKYNNFPDRNHNAEDLVRWGLEGFGKEIGFKSGRGNLTYVNDHTFDWSKEIVRYNEMALNQVDEDEEPVGDDIVKAYPVRTAFSALLTHADCVVEVLAAPNEGGETVLPPTVRQAIVKYVGQLNLRDKKMIAFGGKLPRTEDVRQRDRLFAELDDLAKSLGFVGSSVAVGGI